MKQRSNRLWSYLSPGSLFGSASTLPSSFYLRTTPLMSLMSSAQDTNLSGKHCLRFRCCLIHRSGSGGILTSPVLADFRWAPLHLDCLCNTRSDRKTRKLFIDCSDVHQTIIKSFFKHEIPNGLVGI